MKTKSNNDEIYIGKEAGQELLERIRNAKKSVKIVSPYLSPNYVKELINLHKKGVEITLITCDNIETNSFSDFQVSDLIKEKKISNPKAEKERKRGLIYSLIGIAFSFVFLLILTKIAISVGILSIIFLIYYYLKKTYLINYIPLFRIKVFDSKSGNKPWSTELIHSKIFVIDEQIVYMGSANFTYSGFKTHYETIIRVNDKNAVEDISKEVENLYISKELKSKDIREWGI